MKHYGVSPPKAIKLEKNKTLQIFVLRVGRLALVSVTSGHLPLLLWLREAHIPIIINLH